MHAGGLDTVDAADGAAELALQRAQLVDVLHEAGGAERIRLVEDLVTDAAAFRQAGLGELHAQPGDVFLRHHDDGAVILERVGDGLPLEVFDDRGAVIDRQVGEERHHLRGGRPHDQK